MILNNKIGFKPVLSLVIGNIIGVGIFTTTGYVSNYLDSPFLIFILWILGEVQLLNIENLPLTVDVLLPIRRKL